MSTPYNSSAPVKLISKNGQVKDEQPIIDAVDNSLTDPQKYIIYVAKQSLKESIVALLLAIAIGAAMILYVTDTSARAYVSALAILVALAVFWGRIFIVPTTVIGDVAITIQQLKTRTMQNTGLLIIGGIIRCSFIIAGNLVGIEILKTKYDAATIATATNNFVWKDDSHWTKAQMYGYVTLCQFLFNSILFYFYHNSNVATYCHQTAQGIRILQNESWAAAHRILGVITVASIYYLSITTFGTDIGDPIQVGIYLAFQFAVGIYHGTWVVVLAAITGAIIPAGLIALDFWWVKQQNLKEAMSPSK
jgi:hypothetical protein